MTDKETLEKAIKRAIDGGWEEILTTESWQVGKDLLITVTMTSPYSRNEIYGKYAHQEFIFSQGFSKALWGMDPHHWIATGYPTNSFNGETTEHEIELDEWGALANYQHHLQQMVIADDPIAYLKENI